MSGNRGLRCSAPGRANLIGNPTDLYGGSMLSCSIPLRAHVEITPARDLCMATGGETCPIKGETDLEQRGDAFDIGRAVLSSVGVRDLSVKLAYDSEIPTQAGLAGSTALVVALTRGLLAWRGETLDAHRLAERARAIERHGMGIVCGFGDQYMASFGGLQFLDFRGKGGESAGEEDCFATMEPLAPPGSGVPFLLASTGVRHSSGAVHSPIRDRWLAGEERVITAYERVAQLGRLGKRAFLLEDWKEFGRLMNENHAIQRDLGGSGAANERLIEAALAAGAAGAKLAGAGQGGTIVVLWPDPDDAPLRDQLKRAGATRILHPRPEPGVVVEKREL